MDKNLDFMKELNNEQLEIFVETMLKKGELTETLTISNEYKKYGKNYLQYLERIEEEFLNFGSNTFWFRKNYRDILIDVANKLKINFNDEQSIEVIEGKILEKVLVDAWENLSDSEKQELAENAKSKYGTINLKAEGAAALLLAFRSGGFASYKITLIIVNAIAKTILGRGLTLAANAGLTRVLSIFAGPIGVAITTLWTAIDISGPAYRVIIPCTILIAAFRHELRLKINIENDGLVKKEIIVNNKEELKKAIEKEYDTIYVEGNIAESLMKIEKIKNVNKVDVIKFLSVLAAFCATHVITKGNATMITQNFLRQAAIESGVVAAGFSEAFIAVIVVIGAGLILTMYKDYDIKIEADVTGKVKVKLIRKK